MKKQLTKIMATALSVAMVAANPLTVLADNPHTEQGGDIEANILAFKADTFVVPTDVELTLNPGGFTVTKDDSHGGQVDPIEVNDQIVSLTYGVANLSTSAKNLEIKIEASNVRGITFISEEEAFEWFDENEDEEVNDGEIIDLIDTRDDYAINLRLETGYNTVDGAYQNNVKKNEVILVDEHDPGVDDDEYGRRSNPFVLGDATFDIAEADAYNLAHDDHVAAGDVDIATLGEYLSDVNVTSFNNWAGEFMLDDGTVSAESDMFLYAAGYQNTEVIDFDTTQADLAGNNMKLSALGGIGAFKFSGAMNVNVDWTAENVSHQITLTPTYKFTDIAEEDPVVLDCVYNAASRSYTVTLPNDVVVNEQHPIADVTLNGRAYDDVIVSAAGNVVSFNRDDIAVFLGDRWATTQNFEFTFVIDGTTYIANAVK